MDEISVLELATEAYQSLFKDELGTYLNFATTIGALFIAINLFQKLMTNYSKTGRAFTKGDEKGFSPNEIFTSVLLLISVIVITDILNVIDEILTYLAKDTRFTFEKDLGPWATAAELEEIPNGDDVGFLDQAQVVLENILTCINPANIVQGLVGALAWVLDQMIFIFFLAQRFFVMGIIKLLAPIIIAMSIVDRFRSWALNLIKVYVRTFLTIIPMFLVAVFAAKMYNGLYGGLEDAASGTALKAGAAVISNTTKTPALLMFIVLKFKLYGKCSEIMKSLMP